MDVVVRLGESKNSTTSPASLLEQPPGQDGKPDFDVSLEAVEADAIILGTELASGAL
jgi:hypothetical protein